VEIETQFEYCFEQLSDLVPNSNDIRSWLKAKLVDLTHQYNVSSSSQRGIITQDHLNALKDLRTKNDILILKPDKGCGTVLMHREEYISKMEEILKDTSKFKKENNTKDDIKKLERRTCKYIKSLQQQDLISPEEAKYLTPKGTHTPRLYGLPKLHKTGIPLRPILSMVNTPQHKLAKWLITKLNPIREKLVTHTVKDTFQFVNEVKDMNIGGKYLVSFDVQSLFTNLPLEETIQTVCEHSRLTNIPRDQL
jgi:hypothetical protein